MNQQGQGARAANHPYAVAEAVIRTIQEHRNRLMSERAAAPTNTEHNPIERPMHPAFIGHPYTRERTEEELRRNAAVQVFPPTYRGGSALHVFRGPAQVPPNPASSEDIDLIPEDYNSSDGSDGEPRPWTVVPTVRGAAIPQQQLGSNIHFHTRIDAAVRETERRLLHVAQGIPAPGQANPTMNVEPQFTGPPVEYIPLAPCAFLQKGQRFIGSQKVNQVNGRGKAESWCVQVTVMDYDFKKGTISGLMEAFNVPDSPCPVVTYWEGQIVDNINHTFYTSQSRWSATAGTDLRHWSKFQPFTSHVRREVLQHRGRAPSVSSGGHVFMRWKEQFFVSGNESRLTIAGFYYVSVCRTTGEVNAYYYDPDSSPEQQLKLSAIKGGSNGHAFPDYELA